MPWWALIYLFVLIALCLGGIVDDVQERAPWWHFLGSGLSILASILGMVAYWHIGLAHRFGIFLAIPVLLAVTWDLYSMAKDLRTRARDPELSLAEDRVLVSLAAAAVVLISGPAYFLGALAAWNQWAAHG